MEEDITLELFEKEVLHAFSNEAEPVQNAILKHILPLEIKELVRKHKIPVSHIQSFENYVYLIALSILTLHNLEQWLQAYARMSFDEIQSLLSDIEENIIDPLKKMRNKEKETESHHTTQKGRGEETKDAYRESVL